MGKCPEETGKCCNTLVTVKIKPVAMNAFFPMKTFKAVITVQLLVGCFQMSRIEKHQ